MTTLDTTDANAVRRRYIVWDATESMKYGTLLHQMGGRPGVDPYGWTRQRIDAAIQSGIAFRLLELVERADGFYVHAL